MCLLFCVGGLSGLCVCFRCVSCMSFARVCAVLFIGWFALLLFSVVLPVCFACRCVRFVLIDACLLFVLCCCWILCYFVIRCMVCFVAV